MKNRVTVAMSTANILMLIVLYPCMGLLKVSLQFWLPLRMICPHSTTYPRNRSACYRLTQNLSSLTSTITCAYSRSI
jgi:hypothetical protein